jgi:Family of unknown function (DUF5302)
MTESTPSASSDSPAAPADDGAPEDEAHRKFREALEKKKQAHHASADGAPDKSGVGPSNNTKTTRQFRRKSGG